MGLRFKAPPELSNRVNIEPVKVVMRRILLMDKKITIRELNIQNNTRKILDLLS